MPSPEVNLHPGQPLSIKYSEDISNCDIMINDSTFAISMQVSGITPTFDKQDFDISCHEREMSLQIKEGSLISRGMGYDQLFGKDYTVTIAGVKDRSGNTLQQAYEFVSNFLCFAPQPKLSITQPFGTSRLYLSHEPVTFEAVLQYERPVGGELSTRFANAS